MIPRPAMRVTSPTTVDRVRVWVPSRCDYDDFVVEPPVECLPGVDYDVRFDHGADPRRAVITALAEAHV